MNTERIRGFDGAIDLFIENGRVRRLAEKTLSNHRLFLERFADWCLMHHTHDPRSVTLEHILAFRRSLQTRKRPGDQPLSASYINVHILTVGQLFRLLYKRGMLLTDITVALPTDLAPLFRTLGE